MKFVQTIDLAKQAKGVAFKKRAPTCIKKIQDIAIKTAQCEDVQIGEDVNLYVWQKGIRCPPRKIRVQIDVKEQDNIKIAVVSLVDVESFKGLQQEKNE
uniref:Ribosomal protein L31B n=1 Tax=Trepomonas sp. PC1 TaxID=1076344 RepID=A0A146KE70_9EUKA|eukprot:JAP95042.1 Ribosomal protein L31B [Trepomonas sp. PC1]